jgi:hypothetical protein
MADEVLEATTDRPPEYSMKAYLTMRSILVDACEQVAKKRKLSNNMKLNPESLGKALWAHGVGSTLNIELIEATEQG